MPGYWAWFWNVPGVGWRNLLKSVRLRPFTGVVRHETRDSAEVVKAVVQALEECEGETPEMRFWRLGAALDAARREVELRRARETIRPPAGGIRG